MLTLRPLENKTKEIVNCLSTDQVGEFVYVTGPSVSGLLQTARVDISNSSKIPAIGVITHKYSSTKASIQITGVVKGIFSALTPGKVYYIASSSLPTTTLPEPSPGNKFYWQSVGIAIDSDSLFLSLSSSLKVRRNT